MVELLIEPQRAILLRQCALVKACKLFFPVSSHFLFCNGISLGSTPGLALLILLLQARKIWGYKYANAKSNPFESIEMDKSPIFGDLCYSIINDE